MLNFRQANLLKAAPGAAFTILELLIVVCIIAILIGFALPAYLSTKEKALRRKAVVTAKHLELAFNEYYNQNQSWPPRDAPGDYRVKGAALGALATGSVAYFEIGTNTVDTFKDPWNESYYMVAFDDDFNNQVEPDEGAPPGGTLRKSVIVWNVHTNRNMNPPEVVTNKSWE